MASQLLTVPQVAAELGMHRSTVYRLIDDGSLAATDISTSRSTSRGTTRISRAAVDAFLKARTRTATTARAPRRAEKPVALGVSA